MRWGRWREVRAGPTWGDLFVLRLSDRALAAVREGMERARIECLQILAHGGCVYGWNRPMEFDLVDVLAVARIALTTLESDPDQEPLLFDVDKLRAWVNELETTSATAGFIFHPSAPGKIMARPLVVNSMCYFALAAHAGSAQQDAEGKQDA